MSSEDEVDYMSDEFIVKCSKSDICPGLLGSHSAKRRHELDKKQKEKNAEHREEMKPKWVLEEERRNEGLTIAIPEENKGFAMMQKMGFKPGMSLGKQGTGRVEPIPLEVKKDRGGFGREAALRQIQERKAEIRARRLQLREQHCSVEDFRARMRSQYLQKSWKIDLYKSQKVCENLDRKNNIDEAAEKWFWITQEDEEADDYEEEEEEEEEEEDIELEVEEKLEILTGYLRQTHLYCLWCAVQYDDEKDLRESCPGSTREDHDE